MVSCLLLALVAWKTVPYSGTLLDPRPDLAFDLDRAEMRGNELPRYDAGETNLLFFADHFAYRPKFKGCLMAASFHAKLDVPEDGEYEIRVEPVAGAKSRNSVPVRPWLDGAFLDERPGEAVRLGKGAHHFAVYVRRGNPEQEMKREYGVAHFTWCWRKKGAAEFSAMPLSAPTAEQLAGKPVDFLKVFGPADETAQRFYSYHTFPVEIPEDGYYFIGWLGEPLTHQWFLDDEEFYVTHERQRGDLHTAVQGYPWDCWGGRNRARRTFWGECGQGRFFRKGTYRLSVNSYRNFRDKDEFPQFLAKPTNRLYVRRIDGLNPRTDACFWLETDCLAFRAGEKLVVHAGCPGGTKADYVLEIVPSGGTNVVYSQTLAVGEKPVAFEYPCPEEGAFEVTVKDRFGRTPFGPWEFAVVDVKGARPRAKQAGGKYVSVTNGCRLVDRWTVAEGKGGEHLFRDNGTSRVVETPYGKYVEAGPLDLCTGFGVLTPVPGTKYFRYKTKDPADAKLPNAGYCQRADWFALTLRVERPGRTHVVRFKVPNDTLRGTSIEALDRKTCGFSSISFTSGRGPASGPWSWGQFYCWPNTDRIDVLVANTSWTGVRQPDNRRGAVAEVELLEVPEAGVEPLPEAAGGWQPGRDLYYVGEQMDIGVNESTMPSKWPDSMHGWMQQRDTGRNFRWWRDFLQSWNRWGESARARGESLFLAPCCTYVMRAYAGLPMAMLTPSGDPYEVGYPNDGINPRSRDVFAMMLLVAEKYGIRMGADFMSNRVRPHVMRDWAKIHGCDTNGVYLAIDAKGTPYTGFALPNAVNPAHPAIRAQMTGFVEAMGRRYGKYPAFCGIRYRHWTVVPSDFEPWFLPQYLGRGKPVRRLGYDDFTVGEFVKAEGLGGDAALAPVGTDQKRWEARRDYLEKNLLERWDGWRAKTCFTLREELLAALRRGAPQAQLYTTWDADPGWKVEAGLDPKLFRGREDLGYLEEQASGDDPGIECGGVDARCFENFNVRPEPYGNHFEDMGTNTCCLKYPSLPCCNASIRAWPYELEKPAMALAANRLRMLRAGPEWMLPSPDDGLRRFVQAFRAIPVLDYAKVPGVTADDDRGYAVWAAKDGGGVVFYAVNKTDRGLELELEFGGSGPTVTDLVSGETFRRAKTLAVKLDPYMPAVFRADGNRAPGIAAAKPDEAGRRALAARADAYVAMIGETEGLVGTNGVSYAAAVKDALASREAGRWFEYLRKLDGFPTALRWYFDVCGWPEPVWFERPYVTSWLLGHERGTTNHRLLSPLTDSAVEEFALDPARLWKKRLFVRVKEGVDFKWNCSGRHAPRTLSVWGFFGGDLGGLRVEQETKAKDGTKSRRVIGRMPRGKCAVPRVERRELKEKVSGEGWMTYGTEFILVPEGGDALLEVLRLD